METRILILNADPIFQDTSLAIFSAMPQVELRIVRTLHDAIYTLMREAFDLCIVDGEPAVAVDQATNIRQLFPSLGITCLAFDQPDDAIRAEAEQQKISIILTDVPAVRLRRRLRGAVAAFERLSNSPAEGVDPCHSLVGNLNQFPAAEVLQMSCLGQQSGRFSFKSGRGNAEIYLHHGIIRHALYGTLEGEAAVAEVFRWRQGRFYFEEGIISQIQTVNRPWNHLLIDHLQNLDETLETVGRTLHS
ncbi:MAG: DUF4388 domain-containing protein [Chthoniobacterales bacterium]